MPAASAVGPIFGAAGPLYAAAKPQVQAGIIPANLTRAEQDKTELS